METHRGPFEVRSGRSLARRAWLELAARTGLVRSVVAPRNVELQKLLVGDQGGFDLEEWVTISGEYERVSVPLAESPYVELFNLYRAQGRPNPGHEELRASAYFRMAEIYRRAKGMYMGRVDQAGVLEEMEERHRRLGAKHSTPSAGQRLRATLHFPLRERSGYGWLPIVSRVRDSDWYEIRDGHHRLAAALVRGETKHAVVVRNSEHTYLQKAIRRGKHVRSTELYQPVNKVEVATWSLLRRCRDRFERMRSLIADQGWSGTASSTVLDCACCYGWFVAAFSQLGMKARGIDRDPWALEVGRLAYGLGKDDLSCIEMIQFLDASRDSYDFVLCLSVLHHFVMGSVKGDPRELVAKLARVTRRALFVDSGENHERWFGRKLADWNADFLQRFLKENGPFREVIPLGRDEDARDRNEKNYGRMLFACLK